MDGVNTREEAMGDNKGAGSDSNARVERRVRMTADPHPTFRSKAEARCKQMLDFRELLSCHVRKNDYRNDQ